MAASGARRRRENQLHVAGSLTYPLLFYPFGRPDPWEWPLSETVGDTRGYRLV